MMRTLPDDLMQTTLSSAHTYQELSQMSIAYLQTMYTTPLAFVSGPVTTGGLNHRIANVLVLDYAIRSLEQQQIPTFPSLAFEPLLDRLYQRLQIQGYPYELINDFFGGILTSSLISTVYLLPGWESSTGAKLEYEIAQQAGLPIDTETFANYQFLSHELQYQIRQHS